MEGTQLHRLARQLLEVARRASTEPGDPIPPPGESAVLTEVMEHPGCTISQIAGNTGFVQSHISNVVADLVARDLLITGVDPNDRRRTRVHPAEALKRGITRRQRPIDDALLAALADPKAMRRAVKLLGELAELLDAAPGLSSLASADRVTTPREMPSHTARS